LLIEFGAWAEEEKEDGPIHMDQSELLCKAFCWSNSKRMARATRFSPMLIMAGLVFQFAGTQRIQAAPAQTPRAPGASAMVLSPDSVSLGPLQTQQFSARTSGLSALRAMRTSALSVVNTNVTWSLSPVVGSITAAGLYTAPASLTSSQTVTVTATSSADRTESATATSLPDRRKSAIATA
jgi:hypothetical protein